MRHDLTFGKTTWRKLRKNIPAMVSLCIIVLSVITAIFAYCIAPDNSPYADWQTVEIQSQRPGFHMIFLRLPDESADRPGLLKKWLHGSPLRAKYIPICGMETTGDSLTYRRWVDEDTCVQEALPLSVLSNNSYPGSYVVRKNYLLGTDTFGRDILSRVIIGTRVSLSVGLTAMLISLFIGVILGMLAGYYRGRTDAVIMWLINVSWSIPTLLLVFAITMALGKGYWQVFVAVGLTLWVNVARMVRGQVMAMRELEFVEAARVLGFRDPRIMFRHILPNISGPLLVLGAGNFATAIMIEAGLSFLGVGVQPPQPSWGGMIRENYHFLMTENAILAIIPGLAIMIMVLAFNILGNGLRDAADVRLD